MDWSGLSAILPLGASGFAIALMYVAVRIAFAQRRLATESDARYRAEVADHEKTEEMLRAALETERTRSDAERHLRRTAEEKMDELLREVRSLKAHVTLLQQRVTNLTAEVTGNHDDA